ncbi:hypothetical protein NQ315_011923 [Exocentrus adspersus]|uniref:Major facilitator superfamily (MFS) profile domain-containing protein n=1 Tax=Exocentrus adspersus TaxID=1586481 RepID=A0AAV8W1Y2_9CUCU|nr:hypothetical protein NQ315_011923 [Exocentrus adspersus]
MFSYTLLTVFIVDLLSTSGDIPLSWTSPMYPKLYSNDTHVNPLGKPITEQEDAWLGSLVTIGAVLGPLPFGFIAEKFGRKTALLSIALPHIVAYITMSFAKTIYLFYFGRILSGLAMGGGYTLLPVYIAEISQDYNRGAMSQTLNVFTAIGNFIPYAIGPFTSVKWFNITLSSIPILFFVTFLIIGPETPYHYVRVNKIEKATKSLMLLRSKDQKQIELELESIRRHLKKKEHGHFSDILRSKALRKAFIICVVLVIAQELCGFCAVIFYLQPIFETVGADIPADISALIVGAAMLASSFLPIFLVDRAGRKILTTCSCFGMSISLAVIGTFFYLKDSTSFDTKPIFWVLISNLIFYIVSFNFGICSVPWTLTSELFPSSVKQISVSIVTCVCWTSSFFVTKFFNDMNDAMGRAGTFWFFAGCSLATAGFSIVYVPETKGKSFREIQDMLNGVRNEPESEGSKEEVQEMVHGT